MTNVTSKWVGELDQRVCFVGTGKMSKGGKERLRRVVITSINLTREVGDGMMDAIKFTVTKRGGQVTIGDHRQLATGNLGSTGVWGTRDKLPKAGRVIQRSPEAWVREVSRLIGEAKAREIIAQIGAGAGGAPRWCPSLFLGEVG